MGRPMSIGLINRATSTANESALAKQNFDWLLEQHSDSSDNTTVVHWLVHQLINTPTLLLSSYNCRCILLFSSLSQNISMHWSFLWPVSYLICQLVAMTFLIVVVVTKLLSKWLQNLKRLCDCPQSSCSLGGLGRQIKIRNKLARLEVGQICASGESNNMWAIFPQTLLPIQPMVLSDVSSGDIDNFDGTDFHIGNWYFLCDSETCVETFIVVHHLPSKT